MKRIKGQWVVSEWNERSGVSLMAGLPRSGGCESSPSDQVPAKAIATKETSQTGPLFLFLLILCGESGPVDVSLSLSLILFFLLGHTININTKELWPSTRKEERKRNTSWSYTVPSNAPHVTIKTGTKELIAAHVLEDSVSTKCTFLFLLYFLRTGLCTHKDIRNYGQS